MKRLILLSCFLLCLLLQACSDVNHIDPDSGQTSVMDLLQMGDEEGVRNLVKRGYDKTLKNRRGETAYDFAVRFEYEGEILELLRPEGYVGLYDVTDEEKNIVNKSEAEAVGLLLSRNAKEYCGPAVSHKTVNGDIKDRKSTRL